jgi:putative ATP-dependent endonuclease of OLD family
MRLRHLSIRNFRGIREMDWPLSDQKFFCLIGCGDSTKSTILEAIRRIFHPQWNFAFDDADFHGCKADSQIRIEAVITDFPDEFKNLARFGAHLCGWDREESTRTDEPGDGLEDALWVRLAVGDDLEPSWRIVKSAEDEGREFRANDRLRLAVSLIGSYSDRHLTWSKGSILSQLTEAENIASALTGASRAAKAAFETRRAQDLVLFDKAARTVETTAKTLGVRVNQQYRAHLDVDAVNVKLGGLALHEGEMPLRQLGLGSRRMLTSSLQKQALKRPHVTLFDEIEFGLEPHRIARLLKHLKEDASGTYFLATHSPVVLRSRSQSCISSAALMANPTSSARTCPHLRMLCKEKSGRERKRFWPQRLLSARAKPKSG